MDVSRKYNFFLAILLICCGTAVWAYTPPFYSKCKFSNYCWPIYWSINSGDKTAINPSFMVDHNGDLFYVGPDPGSGFGSVFFLVKVTKEGTYNHKAVFPYQCAGYAVSLDTTKLSSSDKQRLWVNFTPSVAYESVETDYVYVVFYVLPNRFSASGTTNEGFVFMKFRKSDLDLAGDHSMSSVASKFVNFSDSSLLKFSSSTCGYVTEFCYSGLPPFNNCTINQCCFLACVNNDAVSVYYTNDYNSSSANTNSFGLREVACSTDLSAVKSMRSDTGGWETSTPRALKRILTYEGSTYLLIVNAGWFLRFFKIVPSVSMSFCRSCYYYGAYMHTISWTTSDCSYDGDMGIVKANDGTIIDLGLQLSCSYHIKNSTWSTDKISSDTMNNKIVLFLQSGSSSVPDWSGYWYGGPENIIYVSGVNKYGGSINSSTCSEATLYRNTYKFVAYNNYIIYAYCYPGRTKQLILGAARYYIDSQYQVHLLTKTEFRDKDNNSFGTLTNCDHLMFMDVRNGHLWLAWMDTNNYIRHMYVKAQDIIDACY